MVTNESVKFHTNNNAINPVVGDRVKFIDMDRGDATFLCLNCICQTGGNQRRIEATVNQPLGWIFHPPIRGELGHDWKTNVREYTQRDSDSARGGIEQLPDHLSISSESAPVRLGEPVQRTLAAAPNRSQVKAWLFSLFLSLSLSLYLRLSLFSLFSSLSFFRALPIVSRERNMRLTARKIERKTCRSFRYLSTFLSSFCSTFPPIPLIFTLASRLLSFFHRCIVENVRSKRWLCGIEFQVIRLAILLNARCFISSR